MNGWIKLHRNLLNWQWYQNAEMLHLLIHLLLKANHADGKWQDIEIKRGQLFVGRETLSKETGISESKIRTNLRRLEKSGFITRESSNKGTLITICNYDYYQGSKDDNIRQIHQQIANNSPSNNRQLTTNNNNKKKDKFKKEYNKEVFDFFYEILIFFPEKMQPNNQYQKQLWLNAIDQLLNEKKYSAEKILQIVKHFRKDNFWKSKFLVLPKLMKKNTDGILYVDYFF